MLTLVLIVNVCLASLCLGVAWQVWKLRRTLQRVTHTLAAVEQRTYKILHGSPKTILKGQAGSRALRERYQKLQQQLQRLQQILGLFQVGQVVWLRRRGSRRAQTPRPYSKVA
jgi:uncharacterized protein YoxC